MSSATTERPTTVENIKVLQVGKYGVRIDEKTWFGVNEPLTPSHFAVGQGYKVSVTASKTGKKYINQVIGMEDMQGAPAPAATSPATSPVTSQTTVDPAVKEAEAALAKAKANAEATANKAKETQTTKNTDRPTRAGFGQPLTEYDLAVQRQISRAGIIQAAAQSPAPVQWSTSLAEYFSNVRELADLMLKYAQE